MVRLGLALHPLFLLLLLLLLEILFQPLGHGNSSSRNCPDRVLSSISNVVMSRFIVIDVGVIVGLNNACLHLRLRSTSNEVWTWVRLFETTALGDLVGIVAALATRALLARCTIFVLILRR